jgi:hypothetical protein
MTRRVWRYVDGVAYELGTDPAPDSAAHHVMGDIEPFQSPDGVYITGRRQWREHLKATDSIEMGHADMKASQEAWAKRKQAHQERLKGAAEHVREHDRPIDTSAPFKRTGLNVEVLNRLHGKPEPARKELIKLTMDIAKRMNRGR